VLIHNRTNNSLLTSRAIPASASGGCVAGYTWRRDCPSPPLAGCTP